MCRKLILKTVPFVLALSPVTAQEFIQVPPESAGYSPYLDHDFPNQVLFGDTHLQTAYSADAGLALATLSPDDAFADFETWDKGSFGTQLKTPEMLPREYARKALKRGLAYQNDLGENPFKFGMLGSSDSHTGLATSTEDNFFGKVSALEPTNDPIRMKEAITGAGNRGPAADHRCDAPVGNTVDPENATYANAIGAPMLEVFWSDTDFDPDQHAFYYVRVTEIPTPRWTTYDAKVFGVSVPDDIPTSVQDRAYTSPISYTQS
ncbi:DUF3604 domain-containing protein [Ruegeria arenilitoris]|uniref:DUF3604 domain-containing protein n=1 Tax=Ruegeria arenilitoris TaxID=1173585 RepID=UPI00147EFFC6|nr:DUF3604 domain-containing protein [Ruegeria arenilitoris]